MSILELAPHHVTAIRRHAEEAYPEECCGILLGSEGSEMAHVTELMEAENQRDADHRHNRYLIPPAAVLRAERRARELGLRVVGYYHSHPDHPSEPSAFDRDHAWPETSYLIVAVEQGRAAKMQSWRLRADRTAFEEETIQPPPP